MLTCYDLTQREIISTHKCLVQSKKNPRPREKLYLVPSELLELKVYNNAHKRMALNLMSSEIFQLKSSFSLAGDQPKACEEIVTSFKKGKRNHVLLGVTGSGKTFTMANVIARLNVSSLIIAPNKTLAAQLYTELKNLFLKMLWAIL